MKSILDYPFYCFNIFWFAISGILLQLCKLDLDTKTYTEWAENKCYPSEPVFVANPDGTEEDDGKSVHL